MAVELGVFVTPAAQDPEATIQQALLADELGLDLIGVQDHPYQRRFFDTWTLLSYLGARTSRVKLVPDVANLPLRLPAVLAKSAASLDVLTGGRVELGLGAGAFWDGIEGMGGPRRTPGESVDALIDAIGVIRSFWAGEPFGGGKPGPQPAHPIGIWLGAYGPRMLRVTGRLADGWLPSLTYMPLDGVAAKHAAIDEAAEKAGRDPSQIRRALNVTLQGEPGGWVDQLVPLVSEYRFQTLIASGEGDPLEFTRRFAEDVAPKVRQVHT